MTVSETKSTKLPIILASQSAGRLQLLKQIGIIPDQIIPADIDEKENPKESAKNLALRLAVEKATAVAEQFDNAIIIGGDTVPVIGRAIMRKAKNAADIDSSIRKISGRRHRVYSAVCVIKKQNGIAHVSSKVVATILKFKRIPEAEIKLYAALEEGIGKAGGYTLHGYAESFVSYISGSFSNVIGMPLHETVNLLNSAGVYPLKSFSKH